MDEEHTTTEATGAIGGHANEADEKIRHADPGESQNGGHEDNLPRGLVDNVNQLNQKLVLAMDESRAQKEEIERLRKHNTRLLDDIKKKAKTVSANDDEAKKTSNLDLVSMKTEFDETVSGLQAELKQKDEENRDLQQKAHRAYVLTQMVGLKQFKRIHPGALNHVLSVVAPCVERADDGGTQIRIGKTLVPSASADSRNHTMSLEELLTLAEKGRQPTAIDDITYCFIQSGAGSGATSASSAMAVTKNWRDMTPEERATLTSAHDLPALLAGF